MINKLYRIIAITLVLLILISVPISSYSKAEATGITSALVLKVLSFVIPVCATYIAANWFGSSYSDSQLNQVITMLNEHQDNIIKILKNFSYLALINIIYKAKDLAKSVSDIANELGIYNKSYIESNQSIADRVNNNLSNGLALTYPDMVDLGLMNVISYGYANLFINNSSTLEKTFVLDRDSYDNYINSITFTNNLNYDLVNLLVDNNKITKITSSCTANSRTLEKNIDGVLFYRVLYSTSTRYYYGDNDYINVKVYYNFDLYDTISQNILTFDNITKFELYNYDGNDNKFQIELNSNVTKTQFIDKLFEITYLNLSTTDRLLYRDKFINSDLNLGDYLNFLCYLNNYVPLNPVKTLEISESLGTEAICNDNVQDYGIVNPTVVQADSNITIDEEVGTIGITFDNPRYKDTQTSVPVDTPVSIPDIDNPATDYNPDDPTGELDKPTNILDWLKAFWKWLMGVLSFTWLKDLLTNLVDLIKNLNNNPIDWGKFKGFFDIFIIIIFLILVVIKIFIKLLGVAAQLLVIPASTELFNNYPTILAGVNFIKNINVPMLNIPLITLITYMFSVFFFIYVLKIIQSIYHHFTRQEDIEIRVADREIMQHNRELDRKEREQFRSVRQSSGKESFNHSVKKKFENDYSSYHSTGFEDFDFDSVKEINYNGED